MLEKHLIVNYELLLKKLYYAGIRGIENYLITSYLSNTGYSS